MVRKIKKNPMCPSFAKNKKRVIFITGTDTRVGKTIATFALGVLFQDAGYKVGVMKPVQCAGRDIQFLSNALGVHEEMSLLNPYYAKEPLSPHLALKRAKIKFDKQRVFDALEILRARYDVVLVEGAGGLMVPLTDNYYMVDLIRDLGAETIIVSRLGLGAINHTLLTINQAKAKGLPIKGIIFSTNSLKQQSVAERTNPMEIQRLSGVKVIGIIPYLKTLTKINVLTACKKNQIDV